MWPSSICMRIATPSSEWSHDDRAGLAMLMGFATMGMGVVLILIFSLLG